MTYNNITISAKIPEEMSRRINATGYCVSDLIQVSLDLFLNLPSDQQDDLMIKHINQKRFERALRRYGKKQKENK